MTEPAPSDGWQPPALPSRLTDPIPVIVVGSAVWAAAAVVVAVLGGLGVAGLRPFDAWFWACVVGIGMGALGLTVLGLQRRALARGSKGAQRVVR